MSGAHYFEDWRVGEELEFGHYRVTASEIKAFARKYDPQAFHLDETAARDSIFGGLVASGWHSCAIMMRLIADTPAFVSYNIASPGFDELQWRQPVRPGDELRGHSTVLEKRPSQSRPDRGLVRFRQSLRNQNGETAISLKSLVLYWRQPASEASPSAMAAAGRDE